MVATLILSSDPESSRELTQAYVRSLSIHPVDTLVTSASSIQEIKQLQEDAFFAPLKGEKKAVILVHAENLSLPAQNALLKILEEPPEYIYFFLLAPSVDSLLPTIVSRCYVQKRTEQTEPLTEEQKQEVNSFFEKIDHMTVGERLFLSQEKAKEKDELLTFLSVIERVLHQELIDHPQDMLISRLTKILLLKQTLLSTQVNPRMALENMLLSW